MTAAPKIPNNIEFHFCTSSSGTPSLCVSAKGITGTTKPYTKTSVKTATQTTNKVKPFEARKECVCMFRRNRKNGREELEDEVADFENDMGCQGKLKYIHIDSPSNFQVPAKCNAMHCGGSAAPIPKSQYLFRRTMSFAM